MCVGHDHGSQGIVGQRQRSVFGSQFEMWSLGPPFSAEDSILFDVYFHVSLCLQITCLDVLIVRASDMQQRRFWHSKSGGNVEIADRL